MEFHQVGISDYHYWHSAWSGIPAVGGGRGIWGELTANPTYFGLFLDMNHWIDDYDFGGARLSKD